MAEQEFLASFGVEIDESGVQRLRDALEQNRALAEELAAAFDRARESVQAFFSELSEFSLPNWDGSYARVTEQQEGISVPFSLDFTKATQELNAFFKVAGKAFRAKKIRAQNTVSGHKKSSRRDSNSCRPPWQGGA